MKPGHTGLHRVFKATGYSVKGFLAAWRFEAAFRQEVFLFVVLASVACVINVNIAERALMLLCLFVVLLTELLNSAVEAVVDRVGTEHHELSGRAKDIASAAVFISLLMTFVVWGVVLSQFVV
ncbi:diacylglycerol kinase (plasmid) [Pseudoalteromonas xiamenensis]|uniref:diacylglycerol kinase n=1 Tax=Pseudoalteromonas xiamenensis TaxID=882626 RepID=UPI0027E4B596|nr:diacylglycerol kinase [Pseudoalteromonas xiamenensis]WMN61586.1 diacylglycerol kinase [Pseudoalteromonas xiamenensis]